MIMAIAGKRSDIAACDGAAKGYRGESRITELIRARLGWAPGESLERGLRKNLLSPWIASQVELTRGRNQRIAA